jgi:hypothetical protein
MRRVITLAVIAALAFAALAATAAARTESRFSLVEIAKSGHRSGNHIVLRGVLVARGDRDDVVGHDHVRISRRGNIHALFHFPDGALKAQGNADAHRIIIVGGSGRWNGAAGKIKFRPLSGRRTLLHFAIVQ